MKIQEVKIHNFRSVIDAQIEVKDYLLFAGENNAGKSNIINALRVFYDNVKWSSEDFPRSETSDNESWVQITFQLNEEDWDNLADDYKNTSIEKTLTLIRYFKSEEKTKVLKDQSNIFPVVNGHISSRLFYGAKNVGAAKIGQVLYIPAMATTAEQTKMSGPSPLRNMLNFLLKKMVSKSETYQEITDAFDKFNIEARHSDGFLSAIANPINESLSRWGIKFDLSVNSISPEDISKSLIKVNFLDMSLGDSSFDLDCYGHGFQRSVIYELICLAATFKEEHKSEKKEFNPSFSLILFEEPEAFLHPNQQENMAYQLRRIAAKEGQQVIITTHSPTFVGKSAEDIAQIVRVQRISGSTQTFQPKGDKIDKIFNQGADLLHALQAFVGPLLRKTRFWTIRI